MVGVLCPTVNQQKIRYNNKLADLMLEVTRTKSYRLLARDAGTSPSTISNMVLGRVPSQDLAVRVADAAGVDVARMMDACGYDVPDPDDLIRRYVKAMRGTMDREAMLRSIGQILEEEANEPDGYDPEL